VLAYGWVTVIWASAMPARITANGSNGARTLLDIPVTSTGGRFAPQQGPCSFLAGKGHFVAFSRYGVRSAALQVASSELDLIALVNARAATDQGSRASAGPFPNAPGVEKFHSRERPSLSKRLCFHRVEIRPHSTCIIHAEEKLVDWQKLHYMTRNSVSVLPSSI